MLSNAVAIVRTTTRALVASNSSGQLAAGFALGMIIGLVPKGNLIALSLCVLLFSLRCNKGMAILSAVLFSFVAPWTDPVAHKLGLAALGLQPLQATYASIFHLPLGPWLGFDNTVTTGSLLLGLYFSYPVYWIACRVASAARVGRPALPAWRRAASQVEGAR